MSSSSFTLTAEGLSLRAAGDGIVSSVFLSCRPCSDADPVTLSLSSVLNGGNLSSGFPGTFEGVNYDRTFLSGDIVLTGPSFSSAILSPSNLTITAPFSMTATISNFGSNAAFSTDPPLFTASLFGSGTATARFSAVPNGDGLGKTLFDAQSLTYQFEAAASPTPEPASLLLLGTGLAAIVARRRRPD